MKNNKKVVIIGGGIGGLSTAALLAKNGYQVTILEKNEMLGGRARKYVENGYTFDMGPSWYMMPDVFRSYFELLGKDINNYLNLKKLPIHYKVFYDNGHNYVINENLDDVAFQFEQAEKGAGENLKKYLKKSKNLYQLATDEMVFFDYKTIWPLINPKFLFKLPILSLLRSFHKDVSSYFKNTELQKIIEFTTVFLGGSPYNTPAFYELISHTDFNQGIFYPQGGIFKIIEALEKICLEFGVKIETSVEVKKIMVEKGTAKQIISDNKVYDADMIVCNADYQFVETKLLEEKWQTYNASYWNKKTLSPSGFIIYLGLDKQFPKLEHHNLYFNNSWENGFKSVYKKPAWPENPSYYVHVPSRTDDSVAPENNETMMILVPVAAGLNDSDKIRDKQAEEVIKHLESIIGESITAHIRLKKIYSHRDFISDYNAFKGCAFGLAHTLDQTAMFRPKNFSKKVNNLYFVGQYTNPGVGMPTTLISSQIVANLIKKNEL
jgi:phytoene desaturase